MLTQEELKSALDYDPQTGVFIWKSNRKRGGEVAGRKTRQGYLQIRIKDKSYFGHRLAWLYVYGSWPEGPIDHKDMNKFNNSIDNLRVADDSSNQANTLMRPSNTSGFKGVTMHKQARKWQAHIKKNGVTYYLGLFTCPVEAANAYAKKAKEIYGEYARAE